MNLRGVALLLAVLAFSSLLGGTSVLQPTKDYYYGEDGAVEGIPAVTGTFIQPWLCEEWADGQWDAHLDRLLSAGMDTVVLQWSAETPQGQFSWAGFPLKEEWARADGCVERAGIVEGLLRSAEKKGVKVFLGLNTAEEWWSDAFADEAWRGAQSAHANEIAGALYSRYKQRYPNAFAGWYWPWELYGNRAGYGKPWAAMMNGTLEYLTGLDPALPLLFSPFMSGYIRLTSQEEHDFWAGFFKEVHLRPGDIFCPQDSAGAAGFTMATVDGHLAAMKRAADAVPGLRFWVNNETFTADFKPAGLDRFVSQLYVSARYTGTHLCFAYSHYYDPALGNPGYDRAYKQYLQTGKPPEGRPGMPELVAAPSADGKTVTFTVTPADRLACAAVRIYRGGRLVATLEGTGAATYTTELRRTGWGKEYAAEVVDCWSRVSRRAVIDVR